MEKEKKTSMTSSQFSTIKNSNPTSCSFLNSQSLPSSSGTIFYKRKLHQIPEEFERVTRDEYLEKTDSTISSASAGCRKHTPKKSPKELLKHTLRKNLDPIKQDPTWTDDCVRQPNFSAIRKLAFLVKDPMGVKQPIRLCSFLQDCIIITTERLKIEDLDDLCIVLEFLTNTLHESPIPKQRSLLMDMLKNLGNNIELKHNMTDNYEGLLKRFYNHLLFLHMKLEDDEMLEIIGNALLLHLNMPDSKRGFKTVRRHIMITVAVPDSYFGSIKMLAVATPETFPTYLDIIFTIACEFAASCIHMMEENVIENIFYRFNPYYPDRNLPIYEINPDDMKDSAIKLGASSTNLSKIMSLLLVLLKTTKQYFSKNADIMKRIKAPDVYAQRCFIWAYRYECRSLGHKHERETLTVILSALVELFGRRLDFIYSQLGPDIISLSVSTELPARSDWTASVNFDTTSTDMNFKKKLLRLCVGFIKTSPMYIRVSENRHWFIGLMYLLDCQLSSLRPRWSESLYTDLQKTVLQCLICVMPYIDSEIPIRCGLIRRLLWYIEWYTENPFELQTLYWCLRVLHASIYNRRNPCRKKAMRELFVTHGIIIIMRLSNKILEQKLPPMEKCQIILAVNLRLLTSAVEWNKRVQCSIYPELHWPLSINKFVHNMLGVVNYCFEKHYAVTNRWLISLLNFIWQAIIWKPRHRERFIKCTGIFTLLDIISMGRYPVQCIAMGILCDIASTGDGNAVSQLITWRARLLVNSWPQNTVRQGATIATLLASVYRRDCHESEIPLSDSSIIQDLEQPIASIDARKRLQTAGFSQAPYKRTRFSLSAADFAGSRQSKAFALLHMLSEDLQFKVSVADEAYKLYKNIKLKREDETMLILCYHFLTLKLNETWAETNRQKPSYLDIDENVFKEFLEIGSGWAKEVKIQQERLVKRESAKDHKDETTFYGFLNRIQLTSALDALRQIKCHARNASHVRAAHALQESQEAYRRLCNAVKKMKYPIISTFTPKLDEFNKTGHFIKIRDLTTSVSPGIDLNNCVNG